MKIAWARALLRIAPSNANARRLLLVASERQFKLPQAVKFLHSLLDRFPPRVGPALRLAELDYQIGDYELGLAALRRAEKFGPHKPRVIELRLNACFRDNDIEGARRVLAAHRPRPLRRLKWLRKRAAREARAGNIAEAAAFYRQVLATKADSYLDLISLAVCEARLGHLDEAMVLTRRAEGLARPVDTLHALAAHIICHKSTDAAAQREFQAMRERMLAAAPPDEVVEVLSRARETVMNIRASASREAQNTRATLLCPIHRPEDVENAVAQMRHQSWPNAEAVFAVNSSSISKAELQARWTSAMPLTIVDCSQFKQLGAVLNHALQSCSGDAILKIDADCIYMPDYCRDAVLAMRHFRAGLVSKRCMFRYFDEFDFLDLELHQFCHHEAVLGVHSGGTALCIDRRLFRDMRFQTTHKVGEDSAFTLNAVARGYKHMFIDPFNHYAIKATDPSRHTWRYDGAFFSLQKPRVLMGNRDAIGRLVPC